MTTGRMQTCSLTGQLRVESVIGQGRKSDQAGSHSHNGAHTDRQRLVSNLTMSMSMSTVFGQMMTLCTVVFVRFSFYGIWIWSLEI